MADFFQFFAGMFENLLVVLDSIKLSMFGYEVTYLSIIVVGLMISMVAGVFWKGARA